MSKRGARKFSLKIVMCDWLTKTNNQDLSQYLRSLEGISLLHQKSPQNRPPEWKAIGIRIENTKEEKNHQHLRDFVYNTHICFLSHVSLTFYLICIIIPFIPLFSVTVLFCHSPEVAPLQWQLLSSAITTCLTSVWMSWVKVVICSPFDGSHFLYMS